ncbi:hypothetical protein CEP54_014054 [Fusarium duplospermum]|uniref:PD-(D/E)XK nuclease-like domain-containing protein n=1 Tax=Fusarium duplospermum TaxID=1325734 RepID=A0A428NZ58_9HYPO|nr:hypothetical protein CEP54_014054 [Fusarium duplospermum]
MHSLAIEAWINDLVDETANAFPTQILQPKRKHSAMASPERRSGVLIDPDVTPRPRAEEQQQQQHATNTDVSSFVATLRSNSVFSPSSPKKRRRTSPSKRYSTTASLAQLKRPIRVFNPADMTAELPEEDIGLYNELFAVSCKSAILPSGLKGIMGTAGVTKAGVLPFMWQPEDSGANDELLGREHAIMSDILHEAKDATNFNKGESAWNGHVHYPMLKLALSSFSSVKAETITNAQIVRDFQPGTHDGWATGSVSSSAASSQSSLVSDASSIEPVKTSVHKMVDYALLFLPDDDLQSRIDALLAQQKHPTINQTVYEALRTRPAPVFIETKASTGTVASSHVQLAIWTAAWQERLRALTTRPKIITVPVFQVYGNVWQVLFAVDNGHEMLLLDQSMRIGDTSTILGMYQLRAALAVVAKWVEKDFRAWISKFLSDVIIP